MLPGRNNLKALLQITYGKAIENERSIRSDNIHSPSFSKAIPSSKYAIFPRISEEEPV